MLTRKKDSNVEGLDVKCYSFASYIINIHTYEILIFFKNSDNCSLKY